MNSCQGGGEEETEVTASGYGELYGGGGGNVLELDSSHG
jgi:hypothetical protein